jgi:hypothetical protein
MESEIMKTRPLTAYELSLIKKHDLHAKYQTARNLVYSQKELFAAHRKEVQAQEAAAITTLRSDAEYFTSAEFRDEVIAELRAAGATLEQATNRTRDQVRLFNEARELGLM